MEGVIMNGLIELLKYIFKIKEKNGFNKISEEEKVQIMNFYEKFKEKNKDENIENYIMVKKIKY
jgi:hypothetical protein